MRIPKTGIIWHSIVILVITISLLIFCSFSLGNLSEVDGLIWIAILPQIVLFIAMWFQDENHFFREKLVFSAIVLISYFGFSIGLIFFNRSFVSVIPTNPSDVFIHFELSIITFLNLFSCLIYYKREGWDALIPGGRP